MDGKVTMGGWSDEISGFVSIVRWASEGGR